MDHHSDDKREKWDISSALTVENGSDRVFGLDEELEEDECRCDSAILEQEVKAEGPAMIALRGDID